MCIGKIVQSYVNTSGRVRRKGLWNSSSHGISPGYYVYGGKLSSNTNNYQCRKFRRRVFEY